MCRHQSVSELNCEVVAPYNSALTTKAPAAAGFEVAQNSEHISVVEVDHGVATQDQVEWFLDLVCHQVVLLQSGHNQGSIQNESYIYVMYHM